MPQECDITLINDHISKVNDRLSVAIIFVMDITLYLDNIWS